MKLLRTVIGPHSRWYRRPLFFWLLLALTLISTFGAQTPQRGSVAAANVGAQQAKVADAPLPEPLTFVQITDAHLFDEGKKRDSKQDADRDQQDNRDALHWAVGRINSLVEHGRTIDFVVFTGDFGLELVRNNDEKSRCNLAKEDDENFKRYRAQGWPRFVSLKDAADEVVDEFSRLQVSTIYVLPGNNDLVGEDPCDLWRYSEFVKLVAGAMPKKRARVVDLLDPAGTLLELKGFRFVGLNSSSFKGAKNDAPTQIEQLSQSIPADSRASLYLIFTHIPDLEDPYSRKPSWYSGIDRTVWRDVVTRQNIIGVFAGHFHSSDRLLYASPAQRTSFPSDKDVADKTWVAPPLAIKAQDDKPETARGFLLVQVQKAMAGITSTVTISATPFWYEGSRPAICWCYVLPVLSVLAGLVLLIWGVYGYAVVKDRRPELVRETYPTLLTLVGVAAIAFVVWKAMRFLIVGLDLLPSMYWAAPIFGAIGGIFEGLREGNSFALAFYEGPAKIKAGILGDIVTGIGGSIAVVFVSERTLQLKAGETDSLLWLASISFIAGAAARKLVQVALHKFLKRLDEVEKRFDDKISGVEQQVRAATNQATDAQGAAQQAPKETGKDAGSATPSSASPPGS